MIDGIWKKTFAEGEIDAFVYNIDGGSRLCRAGSFVFRQQSGDSLHRAEKTEGQGCRGNGRCDVSKPRSAL